MTLPTIVPSGYAGTSADFVKTKVDRSGATRHQSGSVSVPNGTAATTIIGLVPFNKGALISLNDKAVHAGNFGAGTTTIDLGIVYDTGEGTDDPDQFAAASTAPQSGGFVALTNVAGVNFRTTGNGWLAATINTAAADATADITFNAQISYDN